MRDRLANVEHPKAPDDYADLVAKLQFQLYKIIVAYHRQNLNAVILIEGWDAAGKGGLIKRLASELDPRFIKVVPIAAPTGVQSKEFYLQRFWEQLPPKGNWTVFDRTWYGRVLVERIEGYARTDEWGRAYTEINAFEAALTADGMRVVKIFLHVSEDEQKKRMIDRLEQPWKRWKVSSEDFRNIGKRKAYLEAYEDMFERTDSPHAPWNIIGADHKHYARLKGLSIIVDALSRDVDLSDPKLDPDLAKMAEKQFGKRLKPR